MNPKTKRAEEGNAKGGANMPQAPATPGQTNSAAALAKATVYCQSIFLGFDVETDPGPAGDGAAGAGVAGSFRD